MTNKEKFKEIFGIEPDCGRCNPYPCEENDCKYWELCENQPGCPCDNWWDWEFEEPTTKNDLGADCISRADALALYCDKCGVYNCISKCSSYRAVEKMPSVTPQEPKTGHWNDIPKYKDIAWCCSECEHFTTMKHNYCPKCGADMREVGE